MPTPRFIVTDIEGTTTSISFVHEVLFPYARARLGGWLAAHAGEPRVAEALADLAAEGASDGTVADSAAVLERWIDEDRKHTVLKRVQGYLWADGYQAGDFQGHLYPEVAAALGRWRAAGATLAVYSSGSVEAQQLLFRHSVAGDLTGLFAAWFDTRVGAKRDAASYTAILAALCGAGGGGAAPDASAPGGGAAWFLSDVEAELDAAAAAGFSVLQLLRPATPPSARHRTAATFDEVDAHF